MVHFMVEVVYDDDADDDDGGSINNVEANKRPRTEYAQHTQYIFSDVT